MSTARGPSPHRGRATRPCLAGSKQNGGGAPRLARALVIFDPGGRAFIAREAQSCPSASMDTKLRMQPRDGSHEKTRAMFETASAIGLWANSPTWIIFGHRHATRLRCVSWPGGARGDPMQKDPADKDLVRAPGSISRYGHLPECAGSTGSLSTLSRLLEAFPWLASPTHSCSGPLHRSCRCSTSGSRSWRSSSQSTASLSGRSPRTPKPSFGGSATRDRAVSRPRLSCRPAGWTRLAHQAEPARQDRCLVASAR